MVNYNKVILGGNLTRDVELRRLTSGMAVTTLGIASNRKFTTNGEKKEETVFVDVEVWGKQAELCAEYLTKGRNVLIEGRLKLDTWEDEGKKRSKLLMTAENIQFLDSAKKTKEEVTLVESVANPSLGNSDGTTPF